MAVETEPMDIDSPKTDPENKLSKAAKRNLKRKLAREAKKASKAEKPPKPHTEPRLPSSIVLPENAPDRKFECEDLLAEIKRRLNDNNARTVKISPIPKKCPPTLLQDLCPTAISVHIPNVKNSRFAFVCFKTANEAKTVAKEVEGKFLGEKPIKALICSERPGGNHGDTLRNATLENFDLSTLYVANLPRFTERTDLAQIFRTADNIVFKSMPDGTCKGFCFLTYRRQDEALKAFSKTHETLYKGIPIYVNFKLKSNVKGADKKGIEQQPQVESSNVENVEPTSQTPDEKNAQFPAVNSKQENRKRKASTSDQKEEASTEVNLPNKKRRLEDGGIEAVTTPKKEDAEMTPKAKKSKKQEQQRVKNESTNPKSPNVADKKAKGQKQDAEFTIQKTAEVKKNKQIKLQPYQMSKMKKEGKSPKPKPKWK